MLNPKPTKKSFHALPIIVLCSSTICSFYICLVCFHQINLQLVSKLLVSDVPSPRHHRIISPLEPRTQPVHVSDIPSINIPSQCDHRRIADLEWTHFPRPMSFKRGECECTPVRFFAILSMQRSGSGWFESLLNSHVNVSSNGEIFNQRRSRSSSFSSITKILNQVYNLDWMSSGSKKECTAAVGLKWMLNQGIMKYHMEISEYFKKRGVYVIFLFRRNLLRRHISLLANSYDGKFKPLNGKHKAHVNSPKEASLLARFKPRINTTSLIRELEKTQRSGIRAVKLFKDTNNIMLFYEDLVKNYTWKLQDVMKFLKLPEKELKSQQVKIHTEVLTEQVMNWEKVCRTLKGSRFETFLYSNYL
ncbi:P-loop containing nucleoside triphosphate hydrolases superfamilyprotein [Zostera marina]|uniref:Sulfotransferase n=1 Tax=Zostera marina TaxID=29655 RepID=A0A0K9Q3X2_ZOSMR|nr:P-loop containing nucleoside triphosphate hydrolases superfamilyprotein [Zostera marina]